MKLTIINSTIHRAYIGEESQLTKLRAALEGLLPSRGFQNEFEKLKTLKTSELTEVHLLAKSRSAL